MRFASVILLLMSVCAVVLAQAPWWWGVPLPVFVVGLLLAQRGRCEHLYPALLPSVTHADGSSSPPRWFCCDCRQSWAATPRSDRRFIAEI